MADHVSYEDSKKAVWKGLALLAVVTVVEVLISLLKATDWAKGYEPIFVGLAILIVVLSLYKAYFIIYEFMHLGYEVKGLAMTILLPFILLIWAIVAFFYEGGAWKSNREEIQDRDRIEAPVGKNFPVSTEQVYRLG